MMNEKDRRAKYLKDSVVGEVIGVSGMSKNKLKRVLLDNPKINIQQSIIGRAKIKDPSLIENVGHHHSKDFVKKIIDFVSERKTLSQYVKGISHDSYDPHNRRSIILSRSDGDYVLNVYDKEVGFGVCISLRCEEAHEAVLIAKYMCNSIKFFKKYEIVIR
jgi:hypothetical protein